MELTNHTYLRSRVDMQLADSMRLKASNKISAGVMGNARENSGGFSAGIRFKSNQYLLQSRRANIQNSLSYLEVQRNSIMEARDIMEKIATTKIKFDAPTLNASDRRNLNIEFAELTDELISLREKKFNGVSLFTPTLTSSTDLFGSSRTSLETGSEANNGVGISQHVIDYQDVRNIFDAGDGVKRGKAGLDVINFEKDPVQRQVETLQISGSIADGDLFQLNLNELSSIREIESTHLITYTASATDEELADVNGDGSVFDPSKTQEAVRDSLITIINAAAATGKNGQFVTADAVGVSGIRITSEGEGDPFELWGVGSSGDRMEFLEAGTATTPNTPNDAEESTIRLDFKENALATGVVVRAGDSIAVDMDDGSGTTRTFTYTVAANHLTAPPAWWTGAGFSSDAGTDPQEEWSEASRFMLAGLANEITTNNPNNVNVDASIAPASWNPGGAQQGYELQLRSTERGVPLNVTFSDAKVNLGTATQAASASTITINLSREMKAGDTLQLRGIADGADPQHIIDDNNPVSEVDNRFSFDFSHGSSGITDNATLATAIAANARIQSAVYTANGTGGGSIVITAAINNVDDQPVLEVDETGTNGEIIATPTNQTQIGAVVDDFNDIVTTNISAFGSGARLNIQNITNAGGHGSTTVNASNKGSGYEVNDTFKVLGSLMNGQDGGVGVGNDFEYTVASLDAASTEVKELSYSMPVTTRIASGTYNNVSDTSGDLQLDLTVDAATNTVAINNYDDRGTGDGFAVGDTITISAANIGGGTVVAAAGLSKSSTGGTNANLIDGTYAGITGSGGVTVDVAIAGGNVTISNLAAGGAGYTAGQDITFNGSQVGGVDGVNDLTLTVGATALPEDITLQVSKVQGGVGTVTYDAGTAQTSWTYTNQNVSNVSGGGSGLKLDYTINRAGVLSGIAINSAAGSGGSGYGDGDIVRVDKAGIFSNARITLQAANLERNFTNGNTVDNTPPTISGTTGNQYIPDSGTHMSTDSQVNTPNNPGVAKVLRASITGDTGSSGAIAPGDVLRVQINEILHSDESSGTWPESGAKTALSTPALTDANVISVTAQAGDSTDDVANNLVTEINNYLTANFSVTDREHLPTASYNNGDNFISFTASKAGEDFDITVGFDSSVDSISGTGTWQYTTNPGGLGDPSGTLSATKNISPFSVTKSISYFEEMLAQNEAETSRLMKAMEHLEDSMIHNEDALSKVQDTDYSQASVEHMRNAVKVQMANNVMGKSMRMNDLLIDLTTKHYRGSMLNAKA